MVSGRGAARLRRTRPSHASPAKKLGARVRTPDAEHGARKFPRIPTMILACRRDRWGEARQRGGANRGTVSKQPTMPREFPRRTIGSHESAANARLLRRASRRSARGGDITPRLHARSANRRIRCNCEVWLRSWRPTREAKEKRELSYLIDARGMSKSPSPQGVVNYRPPRRWAPDCRRTSRRPAPASMRCRHRVHAYG